MVSLSVWLINHILNTKGADKDFLDEQCLFMKYRVYDCELMVTYKYLIRAVNQQRLILKSEANSGQIQILQTFMIHIQ